MSKATISSQRGFAYMLSALAICAFTLISAQNASAQSSEPTVVQEEGTLHLGAPLDKGDKGKPPSNPPSTPDSGPGTMLAVALAAGAGYWTLRRTSPAEALRSR
jgi:hypothetical protein